MLSSSVVSDSFVTQWTAAQQAPLSMGLSRQEYWSGLPFLPPGDLHDQGIEPVSPTLQVDSLSLHHQGLQKIGVQSTCIPLHSHQQYGGIPVSLHLQLTSHSLLLLLFKGVLLII